MTTQPRLGFLGVGWIGLHRLRAIAESGTADIVAVCDTSAPAVDAAAAIVPGAQRADSYQALLDLGLDGVVIATPSAMHAAHAVRALERGVAVFCQKPLARTERETRRVVEAARMANRLLGVDFSYRHTAAVQAIARLIATGALGRVFAMDLTFHNAYGPDKPWFYDPARSGGGCVMDLGVHLVDLGLWCLGFPEVVAATGHLFAAGAALEDPQRHVEDYATAELALATGALVRLACSWRLHAGRDCVLALDVHGTEGGAALRNVNGSFYDFRAVRYRGTSTEILTEPPDAWGGRAVVHWARQLAAGVRYTPECEQYVRTAAVLDQLYGRAEPRPARAARAHRSDVGGASDDARPVSAEVAR